jgi:hypothetical protein
MFMDFYKLYLSNVDVLITAISIDHCKKLLPDGICTREANCCLAVQEIRHLYGARRYSSVTSRGPYAESN